MKKSIAQILIAVLLCTSCFACCKKATDNNCSDCEKEYVDLSKEIISNNITVGWDATTRYVETEQSSIDNSIKPEGSKTDNSYTVSCNDNSNELYSRETNSSANERIEVDSVDFNSSETESNEDSKELSDPSLPLTLIPQSFGYDCVDTYFNNSVFIGYSIMMHFGRYTDSWRQTVDSRIMGSALFCTGVGMSFSVNETQSPSDIENTLPKYRGVAYNFESLPAATGSNAIYIGLMPYSDMARLGSTSTCVTEAVDAAKRGLQSIRAVNPTLRIVVLSGTYNTHAGNYLKLNRMNNSNIRQYNNGVLDYCNANGIDFIDVATPLTNGYGLFVEAYASDGEYHIKKEPYKIWIEILREYAKKKNAGTWHNITVMPSLGT